ncbi:TPA: hypothetical protein DD425_02350 [Candidatus Saccharibacteria bacterium]|nr:hypothetical protein [Candidatus Saccharibacteria bacterium]|tara:strand:- start:1517 stop:2380 length:864 start_codon:yes stop_codon:yes gene_type:complete
MNTRPLLGINFDEVSDDIHVASSLIKELDLGIGEVRTINKKNFVFWDESEIAQFKHHVDTHSIKVVAAASPLFKWYSHPDDNEVTHDSFGFNPRLSDEEKRDIISKAIKTASTLSIPRIRIFSELGVYDPEADSFTHHPLLAFALEEAKKHSIDLYIENEPVCKIHTKETLVALFKANKTDNLKLWLDIANLIELDEDIDDAFLKEIAPRIGYIHVKDFVIENGTKKYVAVGDGSINYTDILSRVLRYCPDDTIVTVETHAQLDKVEISRKSLLYTKSLLNKLFEEA